MSILSRMKAAWNMFSKSTAVGVFEALGFGRGSSESMNGWQYKASKLLGEEIGAMALRLYKVKRDSSWEEAATNHDLTALLDSPNPDTTRTELLEATSMHLDFFGNAYWYLEGVTSAAGKPKAIYLLDASRVTVKKSQSFPPKITGYVYRQAATETKLQPYEVLHFRETNPSDALEGLGPIEAMADAIELDQDARTWNKSFFRNSARPDLLLKTKFKTKEQMEPMRSQFEDKYRGASNAHKVAILPDGVEAEKLGWNQKEMDFVEQLRWTRDDILSGLRTPHVVLGLGAGENLNRATAEATNYIYALRTVRPRMTRIVLFLNLRLVPRFGSDLVMDFDNPVPQNDELEIKKRQAGLGNQPYMTVNEVRDTIGLPAMDGGDVVRAPFNLTPVGTAKPPVTPPKRMPPRIKAFHAKQADVQDEADTIAGKITDKLKDLMETHQHEKAGEDAQWKSFVSRVSPYEKKSKEALAEYAKGMGERAVAALEQQTKAIDAGDLLDPDTEIALLFDALDPIMRELATAEGASAAEIISGAFDASNDRLQQAITDAMNLMGQNYQKTTVDALTAQIQEGITAGEGIPELKKRVLEVADFSSKVRAEMVARTESYRVANTAAREAYMQSGVKEMVWYTADGDACEFCDPLNGTVVATEDNFFSKGDSITGSDGGVLSVDYSDVAGGPLHPNCRCQVRPNVNFQD